MEDCVLLIFLFAEHITCYVCGIYNDLIAKISFAMLFWYIRRWENNSFPGKWRKIFYNIQVVKSKSKRILLLFLLKGSIAGRITKSLIAPHAWSRRIMLKYHRKYLLRRCDIIDIPNWPVNHTTFCNHLITQISWWDDMFLL